MFRFLQESHLCNSRTPSDSGANSGPFPLLLGNSVSGAANGVNEDSSRSLCHRASSSCSTMCLMRSASASASACSLHCSSSMRAFSTATSASFRAASSLLASLVSSSWRRRAAICCSRRGGGGHGERFEIKIYVDATRLYAQLT